MDPQERGSPSRSHEGSSRARWTWGVFLAVAGLFLIMEHRARLLGAWPVLLLLGGCLAMHLFMHRGHDDGGGHGH